MFTTGQALRLEYTVLSAEMFSLSGGVFQETFHTGVEGVLFVVRGCLYCCRGGVGESFVVVVVVVAAIAQASTVVTASTVLVRRPVL